jgi:hypothetical protein
MAPSKKNPDPSETIGTALSAAEEAAARFTDAKTEILHRLADVDAAVLEIVQRVYDATPPEFRRSFVTSIDDDDDEELALPDFLRLLMERPGGSEGRFSIQVLENLYEDGDEDEDGAEVDGGEGDGEDEF